jgi:hypothetical protein
MCIGLVAQSKVPTTSSLARELSFRLAAISERLQHGMMAGQHGMLAGQHGMLAAMVSREPQHHNWATGTRALHTLPLALTDWSSTGTAAPAAPAVSAVDSSNRMQRDSGQSSPRTPPPPFAELPAQLQPRVASVNTALSDSSVGVAQTHKTVQSSSAGRAAGSPDLNNHSKPLRSRTHTHVSMSSIPLHTASERPLSTMVASLGSNA